MGVIASRVTEEGKIYSETSLGRSWKWGQIIVQKEHTLQFPYTALMVSVLLIKNLWEWLKTDAHRKKKMANVWWKQERQDILCLW